MKYMYSLIINKSSKNIIKEATYDYGAVKNIKINIGKKFVQVLFEMNTKKSFDDFINFKISPVKDALIKAHIMYALLNHKGLDVEQITCQINDEEKVYDSNSENFPFLFSMVTTNDLKLSGNWEGVCDSLVQQSKSKMNQDPRYSAIYAYLMSKGREFEYDRFQNLWTTMNAIYNYTAICFENSLISELKLSDKTELTNALRFVGKDGLCIGLFSYILGGKYRKITPEISNELKFNYLQFEKKMCEYSLTNLEEIYDDFNKMMVGVKETDRYRELEKIIEPYNVPLFVFMILGYPYYWRCKYFHGNNVGPLFMAHNEDDLKILVVINYFMDKFINDYLPKIFDEDYWNEEKYEKSLNYLKETEESIYKRYTKEKTKIADN